jgi:hypothetical protein
MRCQNQSGSLRPVCGRPGKAVRQIFQIGKADTAAITAPNQITIESNASISGLAYNAITYNVYGVDINLCNSEGVPAGATVFLKED